MVKQITLKKLLALACLSFSSLSSWAYELVIPEGTTEITMEDGYAEDKDITSVVIPNSVTVIGRDAFAGCTGLTSVTIPDGVPTIGEFAFAGCTGLTSVTIPNSVTEIGEAAFAYCSSLKEIIGLDAVDTIGFLAFYDCDNLNQVLCYNHGKKCLGWLGAERPHELTIPDGVESIDNEAFSGCAWLTSVTIPNSVTKVGKGAFSGCTGLTSVTIPNSVTKVGEDAFSDCTGLTSVVISNGMATIGKVFSGCTSLSSVSIPSGVRKIEWRAFYGCEKLTSITIPSSVIEINDRAFWGSGLKELIIVGSLSEWLSEDRWRMGIEIEIEEDAYIRPSVIVDGKNLWDLTSVTIPSGVTSIGGSAFEECTSLTSVVIPNSVTTIGGGAFADCSNLASITIPNSVTSIGEDAFYGCKSLTSIVIPASVKEISWEAFNGCTNLKKVTCLAKVPPMAEDENGYDTFGNYNAYLYIPCDNLEDYDLHQVWGKFKYIKCLEANTVEDHPVTDVVVTPSSQEAAFEWPTTENASTYTLTIQKDGEVFCTLVFNANGQLTTIDFSSLRSGSDGFSFNVTGLREDSEYSYLMEVKDKSQKVLNSYSGAFKTLKEGTLVGDVIAEALPITVVDGVIVVDVKNDEKVSIFNVQGQCLVSQTGSVSFQVPSEGVYVVECNDKAVKVIVK